MAETRVERLIDFRGNDLADLCDAADAAIREGGGFGWLTPPRRDVMEAYWRGTLLVPGRTVIIGRLDGVIAGSAQLNRPRETQEAHAYSVTATTFFVAPWARGYGIAPGILAACEEDARREGYAVLNLDVRETQSRAIEIFAASGYVRWGVHPRSARVGGRYVAGYYYYKDLQASS
ncbi:MAG: GNAT family N-acetyltransferase [Alphaproteobacteria bacterium]|nr:GNAT family N-acetyltransferase [Alphaproteobacteria bacterium]